MPTRVAYLGHRAFGEVYADLILGIGDGELRSHLDLVDIPRAGLVVVDPGHGVVGHECDPYLEKTSDGHTTILA